MILFTTQFSSRDPDRLDITRMGCERARVAGEPAPGIIFAPSKELLRQGLADRAAARGNPEAERVAWESYAARYRIEMADSYRRHRDAWEALLGRERAVLVCFCSGEDARTERCHRFLLARFLSSPKLGALAADYRGELAAPRSKAAYVRNEVAKGQSRPHHCHANGCTRQVPPALFMCAKHWRLVPPELQRAIWRLYNPGQEKGSADVSREYVDVAKAAIAAVAAAEGKAAERAIEPEPARQLTLEDLAPHDRGEIETFGRYLARAAALGGGREAQETAHAEIYGGRS